LRAKEKPLNLDWGTTQGQKTEKININKASVEEITLRIWLNMKTGSGSQSGNP